MNTPEGIRRIAIAVRWAGDVTGALVLLFFLVIFSSGDVLTGFLAGGVLGLLVAAVGRLLSWVIRGFAEPKAPGG